MRPLRELLGQLFAHRPRLAQKMRQHEIWDCWETIVGPRIAAETTPMRFTGTTLVIGVTSPVWIQELSYLKPELLAKIRTLLDPALITDIRLELKARSGNT